MMVVGSDLELTTQLRPTKPNRLHPDMAGAGKRTRAPVRKSSSPKQPPRMSDQEPTPSKSPLTAQSETRRFPELARLRLGPWGRSGPKGGGIMDRLGPILKRAPLLRMTMPMRNLVQESICARSTLLNSTESRTLFMTIRKTLDPWFRVSRHRRPRA